MVCRKRSWGRIEPAFIQSPHPKSLAVYRPGGNAFDSGWCWLNWPILTHEFLESNYDGFDFYLLNLLSCLSSLWPDILPFLTVLCWAMWLALGNGLLISMYAYTPDIHNEKNMPCEFTDTEGLGKNRLGSDSTCSLHPSPAISLHGIAHLSPTCLNQISQLPDLWEWKYLSLQVKYFRLRIVGFCFTALVKQNITNVTTSIYWLHDCNIAICNRTYIYFIFICFGHKAPKTYIIS